MTGRAPHTAAVSPPAAHIERASALCLRPAPGKLAGFFGTGAHRLALRALARPLVAGEPVVAVDGGNRFDPYEISKAERALGGNGRVALSRILHGGGDRGRPRPAGDVHGRRRPLRGGVPGLPELPFVPVPTRGARCAGGAGRGRRRPGDLRRGISRLPRLPLRSGIR
jgi:hypothetical protein